MKYTVHTKTNLPDFAKNEISVTREHEEFIWLHGCFEENEAYAGYIVNYYFYSINNHFILFVICHPIYVVNDLHCTLNTFIYRIF